MRSRGVLATGGLVGVLTALAVPARAQAIPGAQWVPADASNYTVRSIRTVDLVIVHTVEGSAAAAIHWFRNPAADASAHFVVSFQGEVTQMVAEKDIGWHAGNWSYNERSIGIEHEGYAGQNLWTMDQYRASADLTRGICLRHGIPMDRQHIIAHRDVPWPNTHWDPGPHFDWGLYLSLVQTGAGTATPPPPDHDAVHVGQSAPSGLRSGETAVVWVEYRNTGARAWDTGETRLGTSSPRDRHSAFHTPGNWLSDARPTAVDQATAPGQVGRFTYIVTAPPVRTTTTLEERYSPLQEGVTWFGPECTFRYTVRPASAPPALPYRPPETWSEGVMVEASGAWLSAPGGSEAAVAAADWDSDGTWDLLVGGSDGTVAFYPNRSATGLDLDGGRPLEAGGAPPTARDVGERAVPAVGDLDGDGRADLLVGGRDGLARVYLRDAAGGLGAGQDLVVGGVPYRAPGGDAAPFLVDVQGDGLLDLVVGASDGRVRVALNAGTPATWAFPAAVDLATDAGPVDVGEAAKPLVADINRDGTLDYCVGNAAGELWLYPDRNGLHSAEAAPLRAWKDDASTPLKVQGRMSAALADVDGDGLRDLVTFSESGHGKFWPGLHLVGDLDDSRVVDGRDLGILGRTIGTTRGGPLYVPRHDLDGDGDVDREDRRILAAAFGGTY
ncbi:MAG: N-acetylmuramoyl-L-alanine amidase [Planctomycetes bacterium]|nr:N-acetylmuramoyl-L-alanine amidase [Planctomycetota bacterium]